MSVDRRNGRDKMKYLSSCYKYISDENIQEETHAHKKTINDTKYMFAVEKMYANPVKEKSSKISKSTFFKYKPFLCGTSNNS